MNDIIIKKAICNFPNLKTRSVFNGEEGKYQMQVIIPKDNPAAKLIQATIAELKAGKLKGVKLPADKICLKDGDETDYDHLQGCWYMTASSKTPVPILNAAGDDVLPDDEDPIYPGCYANVKVSLWAMNNNYGKRICSNLLAVQFAGHGEPLSETVVTKHRVVSGFGAEDAGIEEYLD